MLQCRKRMISKLKIPDIVMSVISTADCVSRVINNDNNNKEKDFYRAPFTT